MEFVCVVKDIQKEFVSVVQDTLDIGNCYILTLQYYIGNGSKVRMLFVTNGLQVKIPFTNGPQEEIPFVANGSQVEVLFVSDGPDMEIVFF